MFRTNQSKKKIRFECVLKIFERYGMLEHSDKIGKSRVSSGKIGRARVNNGNTDRSNYFIIILSILYIYSLLIIYCDIFFIFLEKFF